MQQLWNNYYYRDLAPRRYSLRLPWPQHAKTQLDGNLEGLYSRPIMLRHKQNQVLCFKH